MSVFNMTIGINPYGESDELLSLCLDIESDAYILKDVIKLAGTYTFSIWHKSESDNTISFNILGVTDEVSSTTQWQKYSKTVEVSTLDIPNIYMSPSLNIETYFYEGFLSEGTLDNSWTPAPEDYNRNFTDVRSEIKQTADSIISKVEANDGRLSELIIGLNGVLANVETLDGNVGRLELTSNEVKAEVADARGNSSSLSIRLGEIESSVTDTANGLQSQITQNAEAITNKVWSDDISSAVEQTTGEIKQEVSSLIKQNHTIPIRYIRDWVYGNDFDDSSSWVSCQVYVDGINIAEGIEPALIWEPEVVYDENNNLIEIEQQEPGDLNLSLYTDGKLISYIGDSISTEGFIDEGTEVDKDSYITTIFTGEACLQIDLGEIRSDIDQITVWHDYSEAKSYNHRFEISEDGENWVELFNSSHGTYIETSDGKSYNFSDELIAAQMSTILQTIDGVSIKVDGADGRIGLLESKADSISQTVADNRDIYDTFVKETFEDFKDETQSVSFAQSVIDKSGIKNTVIGELNEMGFASKSDIEQNSESWKLTFSKIGVNADEIIKNEEIAISMDSKGITVKNGDRETTLDTEGLTGKYLGNKVFWIEDDSVKTERVYCNNGIDTESIKILPKKHIANNIEYGMLVFIKSGGSS